MPYATWAGIQDLWLSHPIINTHKVELGARRKTTPKSLYARAYADYRADRLDNVVEDIRNILAMEGTSEEMKEQCWSLLSRISQANEPATSKPTSTEETFPETKDIA